MQYMERAELKSAAKEQLTGKLGNAMGVVVVYLIVSGVAMSMFGLGLLIQGPLSFGLYGWFLNLKRGRDPLFTSLFDGLSQFGRTLGAWFYTTLYILLWSLLLVVPGIIKGLGYAMIYFVLNDDKELSAMDALRESEELMRGHKGRLFVLCLSFFPWFLLCGITFGIAALYVGPYFHATLANFYDELKAEAA